MKSIKMGIISQRADLDSC